MSEFFQILANLAQERDAANTAPSVTSAIRVAKQTAPAPTTTDAKPAAVVPEQVKITPPAEKAGTSWIQSAVQAVMKLPFVESAVKEVNECICDIQAASDGESLMKRLAEKRARSDAEKIAKLEAVINVDEEPSEPKEDQVVDEEAALNALIEEAEKNKEKEELSEKNKEKEELSDDDLEERPAKKARLSSPPMDRMVGPIKIAQYLYWARAMDDSEYDADAKNRWSGCLEFIFPGKAVNSKLIGQALKLHKENWGFPAYLMCLEMPYSPAGNILTGYNNWLTRHINVDLAVWDHKSEPSGLAEMIKDGA